MAVLRITKYGEPILRQKLKPVNYDELAPRLAQLLKDMVLVLAPYCGVFSARQARQKVSS